MLAIFYNTQLWLMVAVLAITGYHALEPRFSKLACVSMVTAFLACFSGFRTWWYGDLIKYYTLYRSCNGDGWFDTVFEDWRNCGIRIYFRVAGALGIPYDACIFGIAAFLAITLGLIIYKYSPSPFWSYLMYIGMGFLLFTYSGLKQTIAMSFVTLAMISLLEDKPVSFAILTAAGGLFHQPAFVFLIAYPFARKKVDFWYFFIICVVLALLFVFRGTIAGMLGDAYYSDSKGYTASEAIGGRFLMMAFIMGLAMVLRPPTSKDVVYSRVFSIMVMALAIQMFSVFNNSFGRLADYYFEFVVLFVPMILEPGEKRLAELSEKGANVRVFDTRIHFLINMAVFLFTMWYYIGYIDGYYYAENFKFFWQVDAYALYGA